MERYRQEGEERAMRLGNRGPIRFDHDGNLDPAIFEAYSRCGFYVFERLLPEEELKDIERDVADIAGARAGDKRRDGRPVRAARRSASTARRPTSAG